MAAMQLVVDRNVLRSHIERVLFTSPGETPEGSIAIELEWLLKETGGPNTRPAFLEGDADAVGPTVRRLTPHGTFTVLPDDFRRGESALLATGGLLSFGAGGQLRFSTRLGRQPVPLIADLRLHVGGLLHRFEAAGLRAVFSGMDPHHGPAELPLQLTHLRPRLMDAYFESLGTSGLQVMRSSCGLNLRVHLGHGGRVGARLAAAERLVPVMEAIFANSPLDHGVASGLSGRRLRAWTELDERASAPVGFAPDKDPVTSYLEYALGAPVVLRDDGIGGPAASADKMTFGAWLEQGHRSGSPTLADWEVHLSTLQPPIRPRRTIEIRASDTQNLRWFPVPTIVWWALLTHGDPNEWMDAPEPTTALLQEIARHGVRAAGVDAWARRIFDRAQEILRRELSVDPLGLNRLVAEYRRHFLDRGRMPADDVLDRLGNPPTPKLVELATH